METSVKDQLNQHLVTMEHQEGLTNYYGWRHEEAVAEQVTEEQVSKTEISSEAAAQNADNVQDCDADTVAEDDRKWRPT